MSPKPIEISKIATHSEIGPKSLGLARTPRSSMPPQKKKK